MIYTNNVIKFTDKTKLSPWGNDEIILSKEQLMDILQGGVYYYFDGEYGHIIKMCNEV